MNPRPTHRRLSVGLLPIVLILAACSNAATPPADPSTGPSTPPTGAPDSTVTSPPDGSVDPGGIGGLGKLVVPRPGQLDVHAVPADSLAATVDGSTIVVTATWTSGVEPCNILDTIVVDKGEGTYTITLREGHGPEDIACIAIAEQHRTQFEIPGATTGTWTIQDSGGLAPPIEVTVG